VSIEQNPVAVRRGGFQPGNTAALGHGMRAEKHLAPRVTSVKRALLKRMGLRMAELSWAGRETLTGYARTLAKLEACEDWLQANPMLAEDGTPAPLMNLFSTLTNTSTRQLAELRAVMAQLSREDSRFDSAVQALIEQGKRTKAGRAEIEPPVALREGFEPSYTVIDAGETP
jgi:hypothetical protein